MTASNTPSFAFTTTDTFSGAPPPVESVQYETDTLSRTWTGAAGSAPSFTGATASLLPGVHTLFAYATDPQLVARQVSFGVSSFITGKLQAYLFALVPQTISFLAPTDRPLGSPSFTPTASASSALTVNFASNTPAVCTVTSNVVSLVTPGGCSLTASQPGNGSFAPAYVVTRVFTVQPGLPVLFINKGHTGNFTQGQIGATYTITVTNQGLATTAGTVTVVDTLPTGLSATAMSGTGWGCSLFTLTCTRSDALSPSQSYPQITLTVNVAGNAPATVQNMATVSGGGALNSANSFDLAAVVQNSPLTCSTSAPVARTVRTESGAEPLGDFLLSCTGGSPLAVAQALPVADITLTFPVQVGGKLLVNTPQLRGEAFALVDEPGSNGGAPQSVCADPVTACTILATGSGTGDYDGTVGRPNVFQSILVAPNSIRFHIPFDPPGSGTRIIRLTGLRVDARGLSANFAVTGAVGITGAIAPQIVTPTRTLGFAASSATISVNGAGGVPGRIAPFTVTLSENQADSLRPRSVAASLGPDISPTPGSQNVPGVVYFSETGFRNAAFPTLLNQGNLSLAGLAGSGTRVLIRVSGAPPGVQLQIPTVVNLTGAGGGLLRLISTDLTGAGAFTPLGTASTQTNMTVDPSGVAYATYEVLSPNPAVLESAIIQITPVYPAGSSVNWLSGTVTVGLAPLDGTAGASLTANVPRFSGGQTFPIAAAIIPTPPALTSGPLPTATAGTPYNFQFSAAGGTGSYTWSASGLPSFLNLSSTGRLSGTIPTNPQPTYFFTVTVQDAGGGSLTFSATLNVNRVPLTVNLSGILGSPIPVGVHFSTQLTTSSGVPPISWFGSGLPSFLTLSPTGILEGTPPASANSAAVPEGRAASTSTYTFTVTATDSTGNSGSATASVTVGPAPLVITTSSILGGATEGTPYSASFSASGGQTPYQWSAAGLPTGLSISSAGVVAGTPAVGSAGSISFTASVRDANGTQQTGSFTIPVASASGALIVTSPSSLPDAALGAFYNLSLGASGGSPPYTWSETSVGSGVSLSSGGALTGTPASPGLATFTGTVTDSKGASASKALSLRVVPKLGINTPTPLADGIVGLNYFQLFGAVGGNQPYKWSASGNIPPGLRFTSDGILSGIPTAVGAATLTVTVTDFDSNTAGATFQLTIQPAGTLDLVLSAGSLAFSAISGGPKPQLQTIGVNTTTAATVQFTATADASWLSLSTNSGPTPGNIIVNANQSGLTAGFYQGRVTVSAPNVTAKSVLVSLRVDAAPVGLTASPTAVELFNVSGAGSAITSSFAVSNGNAAPAGFQAAAVDLPFITVSPQSGTIPANGTVGISLSADTHNLAPGSYRGRIEVSGAGGTATVAVTIQIGSAGRLLLSSKGVTLDAQEGSPVAANTSQQFTVLALDRPSLGFTASITSRNSSFLTLLTTSGTATSTSPTPVAFSVNTAGLRAGSYYGRITLASTDAVNAPLDFIVVLNVRAAGSAPALNTSPAGLLFTGSVTTQTIQVFTDSGSPQTLQVAVNTQGTSSFLSAATNQGTISATNPAQVTVRVNSAGLAPGVYRGFVDLAPGSPAVKTVAVTLLVTAGSAAEHEPSAAAAPAQAACSPAQLVLTQTALAGSFTVPAGWPRLISAVVVNDCGVAVSNAQVDVTFSNGDSPLSLLATDPTNGVYSANWTPAFSANPVAVTLSARAPSLTPATATLSGGVSANDVPVLAPGGVLHLLDPKPNGLLAPGTIVQIFGKGLAGFATTPGFPPPTNINGTSVIVAGVEVPLYYVSPTQVNAELPFELIPGHEYQVLVNANGGFTNPSSLRPAAVVPGIAATSDGFAIAQHGNTFGLVSPSAPAKPGEFLILYLVGMGATDVTVKTGSISPSGPLANTSVPATVTIDGQAATVFFSGLTPQAVGLYQINVQVPAGAHSGNVSLQVSQGSVTANKVLLPVSAN
jgi:uncharacterized protein (TIGR03437 family)